VTVLYDPRTGQAQMVSFRALWLGPIVTSLFGALFTGLGVWLFLNVDVPKKPAPSDPLDSP
jgi:hypothetical protein